MKTIYRFRNSPARILLFIILLGTLVRLININQPLVEGASTRQIQTAMIARNFFHHGFKLFYPQIDTNANNPFYLMQEFYIIPFFAALLYKLLGGVYECILRLLSILSYVAATIMIYKLAAYYFQKKIGLISAFCFTVSPLSIYLGRAVHPEMAIIFFNMATIYLFSKWLYENRVTFGLLSIITFVMAVFLKIPNLYLLLPLLFIAYAKFRLGLIKNSKLWLFLIASFIPILLFNYHQHVVRTAFPNLAMDSFRIETMINYIKIYLFGAAAKTFYKKIFEDVVSYTLTPIGFTLFLMGLMLKFKEKRQLVFYFWLSAVILFFLIMPAQSIQGYYQIHFLPISCVFIAQFINILIEFNIYKNTLLNINLAKVFFLIALSAIVVRYVYPYYTVPENLRYLMETAKAVERLTEKNALLIASIRNGPELLYYSNRKGWSFMVDRDKHKDALQLAGVDTGMIYNIIEYLEFLRSQGAAYFASASKKEFLDNEKFSEYMFKNYKVIEQTHRYIIFNLKEKK